MSLLAAMDEAIKETEASHDDGIVLDMEEGKVSKAKSVSPAPSAPPAAEEEVAESDELSDEMTDPASPTGGKVTVIFA